MLFNHLRSKSLYYENNIDLLHIKRLAIFASFSANGKIDDYVVYYIKNLKKVCDAIIFVADNSIIPNEFEKIKKYVIYASFNRHGEYDFGSYKRGYLYAKEKGLLNISEELVLCNDSCYAPVYPFENMFSNMKQRKCDFWGICANDQFCYHLQSYFLVFNAKVFKSK